MHLGPGFVKIIYSPWRGIPSGLVADKAFRPELLMKINCLGLMARRDGSVTDSDPQVARQAHEDRPISVISPIISSRPTNANATLHGFLFFIKRLREHS